MNDSHDPLDRLRAADPAGGVEPRAGFVEDTVSRATAGEGAFDAELADAHRSASHLVSRRTRRRGRAPLVAAMAASFVAIAMIAGAAGYALGSHPDAVADGDTGAGAAPPVSLPGPGRSDPSGGGTDRSLPGGEESMRFTSDADYGGFSLPGRNQFRTSALLSSDGGVAAGYGYDARAASTAETVSDLAVALGVDGAPEVRDGGWVVGAQDGTAPSLWVSLDGTLSFSFFHPGNDPWQCDEDGCATPSGDAPGEEAAIDALRDLIAAAGRDPGSFEYASEVWDDQPTRTATAHPVVDGQQLDQVWGLDLGPAGVVSAYGSLAGLIPLGDYPVVSEREAFERLSDPRFATAPGMWPIVVDDAETSSEEWTPPTEPPAAAAPGSPLSWPVGDVEIVSVRLGIASHWQHDGSVIVAPTYEFTDADGAVWPVIAVAEPSLDMSAG